MRHTTRPGTSLDPVLALAAIALAGALACGGGGPPAEPDGAAAGGGAPPATSPSGGAAPPPAAEPVAPISSRGTPVGGDGAAPAAAPGSLAWDLPAGWQSETPSSGMRLAQASIPGAAGPGQLVVFYFGPGGGGGVEANLDRWVGQMEVKPGTEPARETFDAGGFRVTLLEVAGTLLPSGMGSGPDSPQPDSRLLAAVVEGPGGPWFFKATGPGATLAAARDDFRAMLASVRAHG